MGTLLFFALIPAKTVVHGICQGPTTAIGRHAFIHQLNLPLQRSLVSSTAIPVFILPETPYIPPKTPLSASFSPVDDHCSRPVVLC